MNLKSIHKILRTTIDSKTRTKEVFASFQDQKDSKQEVLLNNKKLGNLECNKLNFNISKKIVTSKNTTLMTESTGFQFSQNCIIQIKNQ